MTVKGLRKLKAAVYDIRPSRCRKAVLDCGGYADKIVATPTRFKD